MSGKIDRFQVFHDGRRRVATSAVAQRRDPDANLRGRRGGSRDRGTTWRSADLAFLIIVLRITFC